jgi:predicted negative regulator of RcsB-dependent stress response
MATAGRKLSRKELRQPDWFQRSTENALETFQTHRVLVLLAIAATIAMLLGIWGFQMFKERQDAAAAPEFAHAMSLYQAGQHKEALAAFQKVETYRWSRYANLAYLYQANSYLELNDLTKAAAASQRFIVGTKDNSLMRQVGLFTLANVEERRSDCNSALQHYAEAQRISGAFQDAALLGKGRCLEATGDLKGALAAYKDYLKNQSNSPVALQVAELEARVGRQDGGK